MTWFGSNVQAAFGAARTVNPADIPEEAWIDLTDDTTAWTTTRGGSHALEDIQTGTGTILLHNDFGQYTPGYNAAAANCIDVHRQTAGSSLAGGTPDNVFLSALSGIALTIAPSAAGMAHPFAYTITRSGAVASAPKLMTRAETDLEAGPFTTSQAHTVTADADYKINLQHVLLSGTGTSVKLWVYWLDSSGAVLSSDSSSTFTPTSTVTQKNFNTHSDAAAKYAVTSIEYTAAPGSNHVYQFTGWQLVEGSSNNLLDPLNYPNITPSVPIRIGTQNSLTSDLYDDVYDDQYGVIDSGGTFQYMFYGFARDWSVDIENHTATVTVVDAMELLANQNLTVAADEQIGRIDPLISVPLDDQAETRNKFAVHTRTGVDLDHSVEGTAGANDLSEWTFGVEGSQEGIKALYLDPESGTVGYSLKVVIPDSMPLFNTDTFSVWGWFKIRRREMDGRTHRLVSLQGSNSNAIRVQVQDTGLVRATFQGPPSAGSPQYTIESVDTYNDGEWHFVAAARDLSGVTAATYLWLDWDGTNGEELTDAPAASTQLDLTATHGELWIGDDVDAAAALPRASLGNVGVLDDLLGDVQLQRLYATGAPPSIYPGEAEDDRIERLLIYAGVPAGMRDIDAGLAVLNGPHPSGTNVLDAIKASAEQAGGQIFCSKDGKVTYANRHRRHNPTVALSLDDGILAPEGDITPQIDSTQLYNKIRIARATGDAVEANDVLSQEKHGIRTLDLDMSILSDADAFQAGRWHLYLYSQPVPRIETVTLNASASDEDAPNGTVLWDYLVALDLWTSECISIEVPAIDADADPAQPKPPILSAVYFVEQIELTCDAEQRIFTGRLSLSPADKFLNICTLDDSEFGALDQCVLGW